MLFLRFETVLTISVNVLTTLAVIIAALFVNYNPTTGIVKNIGKLSAICGRLKSVGEEPGKISGSIYNFIAGI